MDKSNQLCKKITIVINSCDAFSDMWENIITLYNKYWENHPKLVILSDKNSNNMYLEHVVTIQEEMSDRLIDVTRIIDTDYIFLSFDDYYLKKKVNEELLNRLVQEMDKNIYSYCRLFNKPKTKGKKETELQYKVMPLIEPYEINFYPSIWKKDDLVKVLQKGEIIWKSEARITRRANEAKLKCICRTNKHLFEFVDVVRKGKYLRSAYRFLKKNNLYISNRGIRTIKETLQLNTQIFVSEHLPKRLKNSLKKRLNNKGKVFYSDYAENDD